MRRAWLGLLGLGLALGFGWGPRIALVGAQGLPRLVVTPAEVDFGTVRKSGGKIEATFTVRNVGTAALRIQRIVPT